MWSLASLTRTLTVDQDTTKTRSRPPGTWKRINPRKRKVKIIQTFGIQINSGGLGGGPTTWYMPHEILGVFHMLLRHGRGFGLSDLEETAKVVGHRPLGSSWFHSEKVQATSSFASQLQSTYNFFFHEYGRRVGMVPRSSLKEGKYNQMVEKRTKKTQQQTKQNQPQPTGRDSTTK